MGASSSKHYNTNINNVGGIVAVNYRALGERHPQIVRLRIDNDTQEAVTVELKTPGGLYLIGKQTIDPEGLDDLDALKATYEVILVQGARTETIKNLRLAEDTTVSVSAILSGDLSELPRDESAQAVTESTRVDEFFSGDVLKTVVEEAKVEPSEKLGDALAKYTAQAQAQAQAEAV